jgi:hypothetical protein
MKRDPAPATARPGAGARPLPEPSRDFGKGAVPFFTVRGHRLSSLYREGMKTRNPFIVLKILKDPRSPRAGGFEYLWNSEAGAGRS